MKVIYITGAARSGSTVMDIVLGNHPEIVSVGELKNLVKSGWARGEYCSCGERAIGCPFWTAVRTEWNKLTGGHDLSEYARLQTVFERYRRLPRLMKETALKPSSEFQAYAEQTHALFRAIGAVSQKSTVVD